MAFRGSYVLNFGGAVSYSKSRWFATKSFGSTSKWIERRDRPRSIPDGWKYILRYLRPPWSFNITTPENMDGMERWSFPSNFSHRPTEWVSIHCAWNKRKPGLIIFSCQLFCWLQTTKNSACKTLTPIHMGYHTLRWDFRSFPPFGFNRKECYKMNKVLPTKNEYYSLWLLWLLGTFEKWMILMFFKKIIFRLGFMNWFYIAPWLKLTNNYAKLQLRWATKEYPAGFCPWNTGCSIMGSLCSMMGSLCHGFWNIPSS